jgi:hypothetical protein
MRWHRINEQTSYQKSSDEGGNHFVIRPPVTRLLDCLLFPIPQSCRTITILDLWQLTKGTYLESDDL